MIYKGIIPIHRGEKIIVAGFSIFYKHTESLEDNHEHLLHPLEKSCYQKFKLHSKKSSYAAGRITAKIAIRQLLKTDIPLNSFSIEAGVFEFPVVKNLPYSNIQVSISHCNDRAVSLAFPEEHPMGIDIESVVYGHKETLSAYTKYHELKMLEDYLISPDVAFTMLWTMKESLSKVLKTGLMLDFALLEVSEIQKEGEIYNCKYRYFSQYQGYTFQAGDLIVSVVMPLRSTADFTELYRTILQTLQL